MYSYVLGNDIVNKNRIITVYDIVARLGCPAGLGSPAGHGLDPKNAKPTTKMPGWAKPTRPAGQRSSSTGSSFPADSAKPVPLAVVSLDSR